MSVRSLVLFLITAATLVLELSMTRLFSVLMFYHFAFLAISLALFGLGASGLYLFIRQRAFPAEKLPRSLAMANSLAAVSIIVSLAVSLSQPVTMEFSSANIVRLFAIYLASLVPFFFSGLAVSLILFHGAKDVSRLYFFDLAGAAAGALITVPLLNLFGGINAQLVSAFLFAFTGTVAVMGLKGKVRVIALSTALVTGGFLLLNHFVPLLQVRYSKGIVKQNVEFSDWNSFSFITVQSEPGQSNSRAIDIDADARTYIVRDPFKVFGTEAIKTEMARNWISHLPNVLLDSGEVLIIGPGGGMDVVLALAFGAKSVDAAEINPIIVNDVMRGKYREFSGGLYERPDVHVYTSEGRSFVARSDKEYDMVQLTLVDTWAATSAGAFSLSENNLYTVEAFKDYINHLTADGVVSVTRWLSAKPKEGLRLMAIAVEAARQLGIAQPYQHIAIVGSNTVGGRDQEMMTFIYKKSPLTDENLARLREQVRLASGRFVFSPSDRESNVFTQFAYSPDPAKFIAEYEFNVAPSTDDQPFFFNTSRKTDIKKIMTLEPESRKNNLGLLNLYIAALISIVLVTLFLVGPILFTGAGRATLGDTRALRSLLYFVAIGLGFIMVEIAMMQKLILYLGHPVYSLVVVLTVILITAGIGSYMTRNCDASSSRVRGRFVIPAIIVLVVLLAFVSPLVTGATFQFVLPLRVLIAAILVAPLGLLLGQPFPLELKLVEHRHKETIPWVWSLNGAASVLGSVAAIVLAMTYGFTVVLLIGAGCYAVAFFMRGR